MDLASHIQSFQHQTSTQLMQETQRRIDGCRKLTPYKNSSWKRHTQRFVGSHTQGNLLRATMLSGGTVHTPFREYSILLEHKTRDLSNGVVFTDVEWAHNCEGIRLFVELDYKTKDALPTEEEVMLHIKHIFDVVQECFSTSASHKFKMHIATCEPSGVTKTTGANVFDQMFSTDVYKKWGIHVVFPEIVTTTQTMRHIAQAIDTRISRDNATWNNVVDANAYKDANATLRPPYSYKASACAICRPVHKKRKRKDDETAQQKTAQEIMSVSCDCMFGYRIQPSVYGYIGTMLDDTTIVEELVDTRAILSGMSILPTKIGAFTESFQPCTDMDMSDSVVEEKSKRSEKRVLAHRKQIDIPQNEKQQCYKVVQSIINRSDPAYLRVVVENVRHCHSKQKNELFVTVKGPGMRWCVSSNREHDSNRAFFVLCLRRKKLFASCFDKDCRKDHKIDTTRKNNVFPLHTNEIIRLNELSSIKTGDIVRRKISSTSTPRVQNETDKKTLAQSSKEAYLKLKEDLNKLIKRKDD